MLAVVGQVEILLTSVLPSLALVLGFGIMVLVLMAMHELGHFVLATLLGLKVNRIVVGNPKYPLWVRFRIGRYRVEIYRRLPMFMALDVDDDALVRAGFLRRCVFALAGPLTNVVAALVVGVLALGVSQGFQTSLAFISSSVRGMVVFFLAPLGVGSSAEFFSGPFQNVLAAVGTTGVYRFVGWWMMLNVLVGMANLIPLPALDGGLVAVSMLMAPAKTLEQRERIFNRWYQVGPRVVRWLPWVFLALMVYHIIAAFL
jgi:membrane-associated protease RseP (regulator of RpoE activity)